jgi:hypothetical protein
MPETAGILITAAASTAAVHTLVPDHWLPFVLLGRAQRWSLLKAAWIAGLSALVHVCISLALGALALGAGMGAARTLGDKLGLLTGILLCVFGVAYSVWALRSGGHSHRHTFSEHHSDSSASNDSHPISKTLGDPLTTPEEVTGPHDATGDSQGLEASHGGHHAHKHVSPPAASKASAYSLMLIVGIHPCVLALPILFASAPLGTFSAVLVAATYAVCTIIAMIVVTLVGLTAARQIRMGFLERHGDLLTGGIIFAVGVYILSQG